MDADGQGAIRLPGHAQRVDLDRGLFHAARRPQECLPADLPLRLPSVQRRGAVAARAVRPGRQTAAGHSHSGRARDRRRHRRARRAALRPQEERLLVRLAAFDRRDARHRALSERHRPAGDLRRARRHGVGARESERRHRRSRRDGFPPLPGSADAVSRAGDRRLYRLDADHGSARPVPGRRSTSAIRGSSPTCW